MIGTKNSIKIFLIVLILLLPWGVPNLEDNVEAKNIDSTTVGYYQINTCDISFIEALLKNGFNQNIIYEFDNYSSIKCFGKINGVDDRASVVAAARVPARHRAVVRCEFGAQ